MEVGSAVVKVEDEPGNKEAGASWADWQVLDEDNFCFLPSNHNKQILIVDDYALHLNTTQQAGFSYWICQHKGCNFRAMCNLEHLRCVKTTDAHNHAPQPGALRKWKFITAIRRRVDESPQSSPKDIYDTEVDRIKAQVKEEHGDSWKAPSYSLVKYYLYHEKTIPKEIFAVEDETNLPSTVDEVTRRGVTEMEKEFLEKPSDDQIEASNLNLSLLSPTLIKSKNFPDLWFFFVPSRKGKRILVVNDFTFHLNTSKPGGKLYWRCTVDPCSYRCVYNQEVNDIVKITGEHMHKTNIHQLRTREFIHLLKSRCLQDRSLTPKLIYDQEMEKLKRMENGDELIACMPAFASIRTSLYNIKNKKSYEPSGADSTNKDSSSDLEHEKGQDISPKAITHLSLEDDENMDYENDDKEPSSAQCLLSSSLEIATPSLYDGHEIIDQLSDRGGNEKVTCTTEECQCGDESESNSGPDHSSYTCTFVPTSRGGQALAVNGCILRSSFVRNSVTYWRCQQKECPFRCCFDNKANKLLKIIGKHSHSVNPWNVHIRSFVRELKKKMSENSDLPPKVIYEQEMSRLRKDGKNEDFLSKLPAYQSVKTVLYKARRPTVASHSISDWQGTSDDVVTEKVTDDAEFGRKDSEGLESPQKSSTADPPEDSDIEMVYAPLNIQVTSWLGQDPNKKVVDGHLLVRRSSTDASTCWVCPRKGCLFRCVIDNESKTVLKGQWYHNHRSEIRHIVFKVFFNAIKRRAFVSTGTDPRIIYDQEKKRIEAKIAENPTLLKFIPSYSQVYHLIVKMRGRLPPPLSKQENLSKSPTAKRSDVKDVKETPSIASFNHSPMKEVEKMTDTDTYNCQSTLHNSLRHGPKNTTSNPNVTNNNNDNNNDNNDNNNSNYIESTACVEEMEPNFGYEQHSSLHQLADFDYPVGEAVLNHGSAYGNQQASINDQLALDRLGEEQDLILNEASVNNPQGGQNQPSVGSQDSLKQDYLVDYHYFHDCHTVEYHRNHGTQFVNMTQNTRIPSETDPPHSSQHVSWNQNPPSLPPPPHPPQNQSTYLLDSQSAVGHENSSYLTASVTSGTSSSLEASSSIPSALFPPPSHLATVTSSDPPPNIPRNSSMDKSEFTFHGYPVFPASAHSGHIHWQCPTPDCRFQCLYDVESSQVIEFTQSHNHQAPTSQQAWSSPQTEDFIADLSHSQPVQIRGTETFKDFTLDSEHNHLTLHGEEMLFMWRKNEMLHWRCKRSECRFKCMYDEEQQSLLVLNTHSPLCPSQSKEIYQGPTTKKRLHQAHPSHAYTRPAKCPRLDQ